MGADGETDGADGLSRRFARRWDRWTPETVTPNAASASAAVSLEYRPDFVGAGAVANRWFSLSANPGMPSPDAIPPPRSTILVPLVMPGGTQHGTPTRS